MLKKYLEIFPKESLEQMSKWMSKEIYEGIFSRIPVEIFGGMLDRISGAIFEETQNNCLKKSLEDFLGKFIKE